MNNKDDNKDLDRRIDALLAGARQRGRPPLGFRNALQYADQYWDLRRQGMSSWRAKKEVARRYSKTPEHISACVKMIDEVPPSDLFEDSDRVDEFMEAEESQKRGR